MHSDIDIIYFTLFPWDNEFSSVSLSLSHELSKSNRIFYINHPYTLKDFVQGWNDPRVQARKSDLLKNRMRYETIPEMPNVIAVHPPLTLPINWLPEGKIYERLYRWNSKVIINTIRKIIQDYQLKNFIYLNCYNPYYAGILPNEFGAKLNIYQCVDDMTQDAYTARHGAYLEDQVIRQSDITFVTSRNLHRLKSPLNPNTYILHNAAETEIFEKALTETLPRPKDLEGATGKIIGFMGNLDEYRINYPLFRKIAERHKDKTLVLVGPQNSSGCHDNGLDKMPNVILSGRKHISELPGYLQHFDVAIIPFLKNTLTASIYPLKINEYLAAGKPVVSSDFSDDIRSFARDIYLAENDETFLQLIDKAIFENDESKINSRSATAKQNTWVERVRQFWEIVDEHIAPVRQSAKGLEV